MIKEKIVQLSALIFFLLSGSAIGQKAKTTWDSIKNATMPVVAPAHQNLFGKPYRQPLAEYGWEDGVQISSDGLNLYTLYFPGDLFSSSIFFNKYFNPIAPCKTLGNMSYLRKYAKTYSMDLKTNYFGCDSFSNIDILYSHRNSVTDSFKLWQLSGIARPGLIEGGPDPLFSVSNPNLIDFFLFTGNNDIWMIKNTNANPTGINSAIRLPAPINPDSSEFHSDNPVINRLNSSDTLVLIYEKYTDPNFRDFMYALSYDDANSWTPPVKITSVNNSFGHIEHPQLYLSTANQWFLYYSINYYAICRSKQSMPGNWDSWIGPDTIITKGNSLSIGEPSLTQNGDISFLVAYKNDANKDTTDKYDADPWFLPVKSLTEIPVYGEKIKFQLYPDPAKDKLNIKLAGNNSEAVHVSVYTILGEVVHDEDMITNSFSIDLNLFPPATVYFICIRADNFSSTQKFVVER